MTQATLCCISQAQRASAIARMQECFTHAMMVIWMQAMNAVEQKRVRNTKIKSVFDLALQYPSFQEGLEAIHSGSMLPFK